MNHTLSTLSEEIYATAKKNGAVLIGTTKIYRVESAIVIGTPLNKNWHLSYLFSEAERLKEERHITKSLLNGVSKVLKSEGFNVKQQNAFTLYGDFRPLAVAAGLGCYGRNGLVINKDYSSGLVFSAIFTNAPVEINQRPEDFNCSDCNLCVELCPAEALSEGRLNYQKCLPYALRGCCQCLKTCGYAINEKF